MLLLRRRCSTVVYRHFVLSVEKHSYGSAARVILHAASQCSPPFCPRRGIANSPPSTRVDSSNKNGNNGRIHDIGGDPTAYGPIPPEEDLQEWEHQCHALFAVLASKTILSTDGLRSSIEDLTPSQYANWTYYEKWSAAMTRLLIQSGTLSSSAIADVLFGGVEQESSPEQQQQPMFQPGDSVRVKEYTTGCEWRRPHIRTPGYIYGVHGTIERVGERYGDPSLLALGFEAPLVRLYRVRFRQADVWPEQSTSQDVVEADIYEHWMEHSGESSGHGYSDHSLFDHSHKGECADSHTHGDGADDSAHHHHDHHHHIHEPRSTIECRAKEREGAARPGEQLHRVLMKLLTEQQVVTADEVRSMMERLEMAGKRLDGATLVAKAWVDPGFCKRLLADAPAAAAELGLFTSNPNAPTKLTVVENTATTHNLVVCTLCSCYPSGLLGIAPSWYKSTEYRSRAVREPRSVLQEFGLDIFQDDTVTVRVHDSTADHRYLVLPQQPVGTEDWSEAELRRLVSRDSMIGVTVPRL